MKAAGRRGIRIILAMVLLITGIPAGYVYATSTQEKLNQAQEEKKETQNQLKDTQEDLENLKDAKENLELRMDNLTEQLTEVSNNLSNLEAEIDVKEAEIAATEEELALAKETEGNQYESMKARIRTIYERSDYALLETLFGSDSWGEALNRAEYVEQVAAYDRSKLEELEQTRIMVEEKEARLHQEKEELERLREQVQEEKNKVNTYVKETASTISATSEQISDAEAKALAYEAELKKQEENIEYLQKKLAEEKAMSSLAAGSKWRDISEVEFEESDRYLLANLIYCEAGGEPDAGKLAVGAVVINRVLSSVYPDTVTGVIYQKNQFSPAGSGRLAVALAEGKANAACYAAADAAMAGQTNVGSCVYFRTPIEGLTGIRIGGHIFY